MARGILSVSFASGLVLFLAAQGILRPVLSSPAFAVKEVETVWPKDLKVPPQRYRIQPPASIFQINLQAVANALKKQYPAVEVEAVRRILPNRLVAVLRPKQAVAQLRQGPQYYPVSDDGTVLLKAQNSPWPNLPILFLEGPLGSGRVGSRVQSASFERAMELLSASRARGSLGGHGVGSIRSQGQVLSLFLDSGLEIRFDSRGLESGWRRLLALVAQRPGVLEGGKYLDLRFEDPVLR